MANGGGGAGGEKKMRWKMVMETMIRKSEKAGNMLVASIYRVSLTARQSSGFDV